MKALVAQIWDFLPVIGQFTIKGCLRCVASSCCFGRGYTHIQGRAASWGSSGCEEISRLWVPW